MRKAPFFHPMSMAAILSLCGIAWAYAADQQSEPAGISEMAPIWPTLDGTPPLIIAHRGASGERPEHTLAAYALAIDHGADVIEPDLVLTKDGVLVARHDRYLSTTTDIADHDAFADRKRTDAYAEKDGVPREDWWIEDFTVKEIKMLRARQPREGRSAAFDGQFEIPTLAEILALAEQRSGQLERSIGIYPETKHPDFFQSIGLDFEAPLISAVNAYHAGPVFIQSFEAPILRRLAGKTGAALVQLVYATRPGAGPNIALSQIKEYADGVGPAKDLILAGEGCSSDFIQEAHQYGLSVHPWTFRDDAPFPPAISRVADCGITGERWSPQMELQLFFALGVDGVFADFPATAVAEKNKPHFLSSSAPE